MRSGTPTPSPAPRPTTKPDGPVLLPVAAAQVAVVVCPTAPLLLAVLAPVPDAELEDVVTLLTPRV